MATIDKITNIVFDENLPEPVSIQEAQARILQLSIDARNIENQLAHPNRPILDVDGKSDDYFRWRRSAIIAKKLKHSQIKVLQHWINARREQEAVERRQQKEARIREVAQLEIERSKILSKQALFLVTVDIACGQIEHLAGMSQKQILGHYYNRAKEVLAS